MSFFSPCKTCNKKKFHVKKRDYIMPNGTKITSQGNLCRECYKRIKKMVGHE